MDSAKSSKKKALVVEYSKECGLADLVNHRWQLVATCLFPRRANHRPGGGNLLAISKFQLYNTDTLMLGYNGAFKAVCHRVHFRSILIPGGRKTGLTYEYRNKFRVGVQGLRFRGLNGSVRSVPTLCSS